MVYGYYDDLCKELREVGAYQRTYNGERWVVLCNFTGRSVSLQQLTEIPLDGELVLSNYEGRDQNTLRPYEALVFRWRRK